MSGITVMRTVRPAVTSTEASSLDDAFVHESGVLIKEQGASTLTVAVLGGL